MRKSRLLLHRWTGPAFMAAFFMLSSVASAHDWQSHRRRPGMVLYQLRADATPQQRARVERFLRHRAAKMAMAADASHECHHRTHQQVQLDAGRDSEEHLAEQLRQTGAVAFAEPDYLLPAAVVPNDPNYSTQWFHNHIDSPSAWDITKGNSSVIVAICDTGVDAQHPDLAGRVLPGHNVVDDSNDSSPIADHGTEVAGVAAAAGNNARGGAGLAWNVKILPVRITNSTDTSAWCSDMAAGIEWAADHGAKVINLSYSTTGCPGIIDSASQYARQKGALVFIAAGNQGINLIGTYPTKANYIMVGATGQNDTRASYSNYGTPIDIVAPGSSIFTTAPGGGYASPSGTSFASPIAAGIAALIYSIKPTFTPDQVQNLIYSTTDDVGSTGDDSTYGRGMVNAGAAVKAAHSLVIGNLPPSVSAGSAQTIVWPSTATVQATVSDDGLPASPGAVSVVWSKISGPGAVTFASASSRTTSVRFSYAGRYVLRVTASDGFLKTRSDVSIMVRPGPNGEGGLPAPSLRLPSILSLRSQISAEYPDGYDIARYEWSISMTVGHTKGAAVGSGGMSASWETERNTASLGDRHLVPGDYLISVQAFDPTGIISEPAEAYVTLVPADLDGMRVFPNPWRSDRHSGAPVTFDQLAGNTTVKIFTVSGHQVRTLSSSDNVAKWDLKTDTGDEAASGLYLFLVTNDFGQKRTGKMAIIH